jgi:hypothetical protein
MVVLLSLIRAAIGSYLYETPWHGATLSVSAGYTVTEIWESSAKCTTTPPGSDAETRAWHPQSSQRDPCAQKRWQ